MLRSIMISSSRVQTPTAYYAVDDEDFILRSRGELLAIVR